jgi:hypothetical protein
LREADMAKFTIGGVEVDESEVDENELLNIEYCFIAFNKMLDDLLNNWRVRETDPAAAIAQAEKSISTTRRIIERLKDPASSGPRN